jgi:hypothetical protein
MVREPSESMCKLIRLEIFRPSAMQGGDITDLTIASYNVLLSTKHSHIFQFALPFELPHAAATTSKNS